MSASLADDGAVILAALASQAVAALLFSAYLGWRRARRFVKLGEVSGLNIYPVKSCAGLPVQSGLLTSLGLSVEGITDRHWLVVQENGDFLTQRQIPGLALVRAVPQGSGVGQEMTFSAPDMPLLRIPAHPVIRRDQVRQCRVWTGHLEGLDCGEEAARWFSKVVGREGIRLLFSAPGLVKKDCTEEKKPWGNLAKSGDLAAYADSCAYLVTSEASLAEVNNRLDTPVTMRNFRPNIVISGSPAFDEDSWLEIRIGKAHLRILDPCTRCVLTTVNPDTGVKDPRYEPLETLKKFRCFPTYGASPLFGVNATLDGDDSIIRLGDPVYVLKK